MKEDGRYRHLRTAAAGTGGRVPHGPDRGRAHAPDSARKARKRYVST